MNEMQWNPNYETATNEEKVKIWQEELEILKNIEFTFTPEFESQLNK